MSYNSKGKQTVLGIHLQVFVIVSMVLLLNLKGK